MRLRLTSGINVTLYKYLHLYRGALCGLGGAYMSLVMMSSWQENIGRPWLDCCCPCHICILESC